MTTAVQLAQSVAPGVSLGFKNRIINGGMTIDQRNAGASGTASSTYTVDRWVYQASQNNKGTWGQNLNSVTPPAGFTKYLGFQTGASPYSVLSADYFDFYQMIEGNNVSDLGWGTATAQPVTLSFWVRSSLTGTFGGSVRNGGNDRSYPFAYTISVANTWEKKTITVPGDVTGSWSTTNTTGLWLTLSLGMGSNYVGAAGAWSSFIRASVTGETSVVGTANATFYITGVQLEVGTAATSFEFRDYGRELLMCQRYYENSFSFGNQPGVSTASTDSIHTTAFSDGNSPGTIFKVVKRTIPTVVLRAQGSTVTGQAGNSSGNTSATATNTGTSQVSYIEMGAKIAGSYVRYTYEANAEL